MFFAGWFVLVVVLFDLSLTGFENISSLALGLRYLPPLLCVGFRKARFGDLWALISPDFCTSRLPCGLFLVLPFLLIR